MMTGYAQSERHALADTLLEVGPDAPTLCEGWTAADLAAHLVIRDSRPDAALGIVFQPAARWTARVQNDTRDRHAFGVLVERVRNGPPVWSPTRIGAVDRAANTIEFFVHHEDLRRGKLPQPPRDLDPEFEAQLWHRLRGTAKLMFRKSPVGVTLVHTSRDKGAPRATVVAKHANPQMVTVAGSAGELLLFAFGRTEAAEVELSGDEAAAARLRGARLGI
jgi:uncharacterized protein (TIGR03085 family)